MRHSIVCMFALLVSSVAVAQEEPRFTLRGEYQTGSNIAALLARSSKIPLNKRYNELSVEQKAIVASHYESLGDGDEPPFPIDGLAPVVRALHHAQAQLLVSGPLFLIVDVASDGSATEVKAIGSPSPEMTKLAASVLVLTKYKPAICAGQPCRMQFPFALQFEVR